METEDIKVPGMESVVASVSGYHGSERFDLIKLISLAGASYVGAMSRSTTHLVCWKFEGEKYKIAKKFKTIIVNHQWVEDCINQGKRVHEYPYMLQSGQEVGPLSLKFPKFNKPEPLRKNRKPLSEKSNICDDSERLLTDLSAEDCGLAQWTNSVLLDEDLYPVSLNGDCNSYKSKSKRENKSLRQQCLTSSRYCFQDPPLTGSARSEHGGSGSISSMHYEKKKGKNLWKEESCNLSGMHLASGKRKVSDDLGSSSLPEADCKGKKIVRNNSDNNFDGMVLDLEDSPTRLHNKNGNTKSLSKCVDGKMGTSICNNRETSNASMNSDGVSNDGAFDDIEEIGNWKRQPASKASSSSSKDAHSALEGSDGCADLDKSNKRIKDTAQFTPSAKSSTSDLSCVICWTEFCSTRGILPCGHRFCYSCIQSWADVMVSKRKMSTCPLCKSSFLSITKVEDAGTSDQKIYSQTIPCATSTSDIFIFTDQERYVSEQSLSQVCSECRCREPVDLLLSCHLCQLRYIHSYCLDPPLLPWTCVHCKDLQMLYHQNY